MKFDLSRFRTVELIKGNPTISVTKNGITFSQAAIQKLGKPEFVEFLIDDENKVIAVVKKEKEGANCFHFYMPNKKVLSVRISNKELKNQIREMMSWDFTNDEGYKVEGEYDKENQALFFDLKEAKPLNR